MMIKFTILVEPYDETREMMKKYLPFDRIYKMEHLEIMNIDIKSGRKLYITKINLKEGYSIEDLNYSNKDGLSYKVLDIIDNNKNEYMVLLKVEEFGKIFQITNPMRDDLFDLNVKIETPIVFDEQKIILTVIGEKKSLDILVDHYQKIGRVEILHSKKMNFDCNNILSVLTQKQMDVFLKAFMEGYYDFPRKISAKSLAKNIGKGKATILEHLRKSEKKIFSEIVYDYEK